MKQIKADEHVFLCGMTGSGKTFLAKTYLASFRNVIVLDTKGFFTWDNAGEVPLFTSLDELKNFGEGKAIYRPNINELNPETYNDFFKWVYFRQNTIVYVDEITDISRNSMDIPFYAKGILTRGRERKTAMWASTQRPKSIPLYFMSEATHYFIFALKLDADRERIYEIIPYREVLTPIQKESHKFWYYNDSMDKPVLARLSINKKYKSQEESKK